MRAMLGGRVVCSAVAAGLLSLFSGCAVFNVEMTSSPDSVRQGDPVTFDFKVTNASQCPTSSAIVEIVAFVSTEDLFAEFTGGLPPDLPPEVETFLQELRDFFDELCSGGTPDFPEIPMVSMSCSRGDDEVLCRMSSDLAAHEGSSGSMNVSGLGDRLQCEIDGATISCLIHFPFARPGGSASGGGAATTKTFTCLTAEDFGGDPDEEVGALCFLGTFPIFDEGLDPGEMATGQVALPARGEGFVRNFVIAFTSEDVGVCKAGGSDAGKPCDPEDTNSCTGSTCGRGICVAPSANEGLGCSVGTEVTDCGGAGQCVECEPEDPQMGVLPIDCTTTYIAPETLPTMSPWGLAALAALLLLSGSFWLHRRGRRSAP